MIRAKTERENHSKFYLKFLYVYFTINIKVVIIRKNQGFAGIVYSYFVTLCHKYLEFYLEGHEVS